MPPKDMLRAVVSKAIANGATPITEILTLATQQARLETAWRAAGDALKGFPKGAMGLTPDSVKASPEWQAAKRAYESAFAALRAFNGAHTAELRAAHKQSATPDRAGA